MSEKYSIGELIEKGNFSIIHKFIDKKIQILLLVKSYLSKMLKIIYI
jgi:hypothetical protein